MGVPKYVAALYLAAGVGLYNAGTATLQASWPYGCCTSSDNCSGALICCTPPSGWASCSTSNTNYCNAGCPPDNGGS
jgi:hypothetical protein